LFSIQGATLIERLGAIDRLEIHDVTVEFSDLVPTDILIGVVLVEIDVQEA